MYQTISAALALAILATPVMAQSRFQTEAADRAARHARDQSFREIENPQPQPAAAPAATAAAQPAAQPAPAEPAPQPAPQITPTAPAQ